MEDGVHLLNALVGESVDRCDTHEALARAYVSICIYTTHRVR